MNYRPLPEDRTEQYQDYVQYAFSITKGPQEEHEWHPDDQPGHPRALFDGDRMLCVCRHYWFQTRLRGHRIGMAGLSAVASPPEHRRRGYVTRLMAESLEEYRDRGNVLTSLWAFDFPFYERHGWGMANKTVEYEFAPEAVSFARREARRASNSERGDSTREQDHASGEFRPLEFDEYERLEPVLSADAEGYELEIDRSELWWEKRIFHSVRGDPYVYGWEKDGEIRGYVVYRVSDGDDGRRLHAEEFVAADREARLNLLRFLANHDSQVERVTVYAPHDTTLLDAADDPADTECEVEPGPMVRIVDVPAAFEALDYPDAPDSEFTVAVTDSLADWNDRTFRVTVADGRATCEPIPADETADPDVTTGVATLSQAYVGYHSVEDAETFGELDVRDSTVRETLAAMFPPREVFLREQF
jgi:predicted acetyltransferase